MGFILLYLMGHQDDNSLIYKIGRRLKALRKQKGYSNYEDFANRHNINRSQYGRYENGENLRLSSLEKVLDALGVTIKEFFSEGFD